jgi:hypothetical protein
MRKGGSGKARARRSIQRSERKDPERLSRERVAGFLMWSTAFRKERTELWSARRIARTMAVPSATPKRVRKVAVRFFRRWETE